MIRIVHLESSGGDTKLKKPEDVLLILGSILLAIGLFTGLGGLIWGANAFSQVQVQTGMRVGFIGILVGIPMLMLGLVLIVAAIVVHAATKRKPPVIPSGKETPAR